MSEEAFPLRLGLGTRKQVNGMVRRRTLAGIVCGARGHLMKIYALGIDLGKTVFHLVGLDSSGQVVVRKRCSRTQLLAFAGNLQVQLIGMEACSGAHFLGKALRAQGHDVRLMPAQYVKPYVKTNKSDYNRCGSDCRSGATTPDAFCADQDGGATGSAGTASSARALGDATYRSGEPDSQPSSGW
jgi:hypothetical protein